MPKITRRGFAAEDLRNFSDKALPKLNQAADDLRELLDRGYPIRPASTFVGNHYLLSERQRLAVTRSVSSSAELKSRLAKELAGDQLSGAVVNMDGFNTIITLEVALSASPVLLCMDGTCRDLAGLRGTYRLIDKTDPAIRLIVGKLRELGAAGAKVFLDRPVSNSGRLKTRIAEIAEESGFPVQIELADDVDAVLSGLPNVITGDSVILDRCESWFNLNGSILPELCDTWIIRLGPAQTRR
jgi:hypothetical protein